MDNVLKEIGYECIKNAPKSMDIKIRLEQWPCAVAVLGLCATYAFVRWLNSKPATT